MTKKAPPRFVVIFLTLCFCSSGLLLLGSGDAISHDVKPEALRNRDSALVTVVIGWDDEADDPPEGADHIDDVHRTGSMESPSSMRLRMALWKHGRGANRLWKMPPSVVDASALLAECGRLCHAASFASQCVAAGVVRASVDGAWYCVGRRTAGVLAPIKANYSALVLGVVRVAPSVLRTAEVRVISRAGLLWSPVKGELQLSGVEPHQHVARNGVRSLDGATVSYVVERSPFETARVAVTLGGARWQEARARGMSLRVRVKSWSRVEREVLVPLVVDDGGALNGLTWDGAVRAEFGVGAVLGALHVPQWTVTEREGIVRMEVELSVHIGGMDAAVATTAAVALVGPSADGLMAWVDGGVVRVRVARCRDSGSCVAAVPASGKAHDMAFVGAMIRRRAEGERFVPGGGQRFGGLDREGQTSLPGLCVPRSASSAVSAVKGESVDVRVGFRFDEEPWTATISDASIAWCKHATASRKAVGDTRVLVSVTAHECVPCIAEHAVNIRRGVGEANHAGTVFHLSRGFTLSTQVQTTLATLGKTWINSYSARTAVGFLILDAHIANLRYMRQSAATVQWDYVIFVASNERFVRHGVVASMQGFDAALMAYAYDAQQTTAAYSQLCTGPLQQQSSTGNLVTSRARHVASVRPLSAVPARPSAANVFKGPCPSVTWADVDDPDPGKHFWPTLAVPPLDDPLLLRLLVVQSRRLKSHSPLMLPNAAIAFEGTYMSRAVADAFVADLAEADSGTTEQERRCLPTYPTSELYVAAWLYAECGARGRCGPRVSTVFWCRDPLIDAEAVDGEWVPTASDLRGIVCEGGADEVYLVKRVKRVPVEDVGANGTVLQRWLAAFGRGAENATDLCQGSN